MRWWWCFVVVAGCWGEQQRIDDTFTPEEWDYLQTFRLDRLAPITCTDQRCIAVARFGQKLFFDPSYSGTYSSPEVGPVMLPSNVACVQCHDPAKYFIDGRPDNAQSSGAGWTGRNVPGLVDLGYRTSFTWGGKYTAIKDVLELALNPKALNSNAAAVEAIVTRDYFETYQRLFPGDPNVYDNASFAIGVYETQLVSSTPSRFDQYLGGNADAMTASEKRGAQLFIGKGLCSECHDGPLFADNKFHATGIEQRGPHAPETDTGRYAVTSAMIDLGKFRTPSLRHVDRTAPYMHAGQLATLTEVVEFYRWGGDSEHYTGVKDPRIVPLEIDDQDARDLEAFLHTLTGGPVDPMWTTP